MKDIRQTIRETSEESIEQLSKNVRASLRDALNSDRILETLFAKSVPKHKHSIWYYVGGLTLMTLVVQITTGVLLLMYFEPSQTQSLKSLQTIIHKVPFGWLVRSLHSWCASIAIFLTLVHMFSVYFMKSYRAPREILWVTGILLLGMMLGFGYTGYQLPLMHGPDLRRFFALHVTVFPIGILIVLLSHLSLTALLGNSVPPGVEVKGRTPFFTDYVLWEVIVWLIGFAVILLVAWFFPWDFNASDFAPKGALQTNIPPDWYLVFYSAIEQPFADWLGLIVLVVLTVVWTMVPWLDRRSARDEKSPAFTAIGVVVLLAMLLMTALAYFSVDQEKAKANLGIQDPTDCRAMAHAVATPIDG